MTKNILILGATSSIARAMANQLAAQGHNLYLASRDTEELQRISKDIQIRFSNQVNYELFDAQDFSSHKKFWQNALENSPAKKIDGVIIAFGFMGDNNDPVAIIDANLTGAISILNECREYFAEKKEGFIAVIGSVAGDRGRRQNYAYAAAKGGLAVYLQGLRNNLAASNIQVMTIKLGFVDTAMVFGRKDLFLVAQPEQAAKKILRALKYGRNVTYIPWFWRYLILIVKSIPEKIFKHLKF